MRRQMWLILAAARLTAAASFFCSVFHLDDVAVNRHLAEIRAHVPCTELRHFVLDDPFLVIGDEKENLIWSCAVSHKITPSIFQRTFFP